MLQLFITVGKLYYILLHSFEIVKLLELLRKNWRWWKIWYSWVFADLKGFMMQLLGTAKCLTLNSAKSPRVSRIWRRTSRGEVERTEEVLDWCDFSPNTDHTALELSVFSVHLLLQCKLLTVLFLCFFNPALSTGFGTESSTIHLCGMCELNTACLFWLPVFMLQWFFCCCYMKLH